MSIKIALLTFTLLALGGCASSRPDATAAPPRAVYSTATPTPHPPGPLDGMSVEEFIRTKSHEPDAQKAKMLRAWRSVPGHERYRLTRSDDFVIPESVRPAETPYRVERLGASYQWGEFSGNFGGNYVLLVADGEKTTPDRFGVLLLLDRDGKRYEVHWVRRDEDFTPGASLGRSSGNINLEAWDARGGRTLCRIAWSRRQRRFACEAV